MIYAPRSSRGGLQGSFKRAAHNLHFLRPHTMMTTMGVPLVTAFEVEAVKRNSKYEKRQALKRFEKLR
jgi:hypothetical protein